MTRDVYSGLVRVGRVEKAGRIYRAFAWDDREGALRPLGSFPTAKAARDAILSTEARHAA